MSMYILTFNKNDNNAQIMTKLGLRDSVLTLTLIPTVIIGLLLGGYFTINRYIELDEILYQQGTTISEPLAIALEQPLLEKNKKLLNRVIRYTHNKHSPAIKSIAIFTGLSVVQRERIDFGATWMDAELAAPANDGAWQTFNAKVTFPQAGYYEVWAKATDDQEVSQPFAIAWNPKGYLNDTFHRIALIVKG